MPSLALEVWRFCWSLTTRIRVGSPCRNASCSMRLVDAARVGDGCSDRSGTDEKEPLDMRRNRGMHRRQLALLKVSWSPRDCSRHFGQPGS